MHIVYGRDQSTRPYYQATQISKKPSLLRRLATDISNCSMNPIQTGFDMSTPGGDYMNEELTARLVISLDKGSQTSGFRLVSHSSWYI